MKICPRCQMRYDEDSRFCGACGSRLVPERALGPKVRAKREVLEQHLAQDTSNPTLHLELGKFLEEAGLLEDALLEYHRVIALLPGQSEALSRLVTIELDQGSLDEAEAHLVELLRLRPEDVSSYEQLAVVLEKRGRHREALDALARASYLAPDNVSILRARRERLDAHPQEQIEVCRELLRLQPEDLESLDRLSLALRRSGDRAASLKVDRRSLEVDPEYPGATLRVTLDALAADPFSSRAAELGRSLERAAGAPEISARERADARLYLTAAGLAELPTHVAEERLRDLDPSHYQPTEVQVLAECWSRLGDRADKPGEKVDAYRESLQILPNAGVAAKLKKLERRRTLFRVNAALAATLLIVVASFLLHRYYAYAALELTLAPVEMAGMSMTPDAAQVLVDGKLLGQLSGLPSLRVTAGRVHRIGILHSGFLPYEASIRLAGREKRKVQVVLQPRSGTLDIVTGSDAVSVSIDGKLVGTTPLHALPCQVGQHALSLSAPLHLRKERSIVVEEGRELRLEEGLELEPAIRAQQEAEMKARADQEAREWTDKKAREDRQRRQREEDFARMRQALVGRWYFDRPPSTDPTNFKLFDGAYIEIETVSERGAFTGGIVLPAYAKRARVRGTLTGAQIEMSGPFPIVMRDWTGRQARRTWTGTIDPDVAGLSGNAEQDTGWRLRSWSAHKR